VFHLFHIAYIKEFPDINFVLPSPEISILNYIFISSSADNSFFTQSSTMPEFNPFNSDPPDGILEGFEGPEKRLEVTFSLTSKNPKGMRRINKDEWQTMLNLVKCVIISQTSNEWADSYVLSESSLFVYPNKILLKTCGTTTLLKCLDTLQEYADRCHCRIMFVTFSRKNFNFPHKQPECHRNFETEVQILKRTFPDGNAHILGPVFKKNQDHHLYYFADLRNSFKEEEISSTISSSPPLCPFTPTLEILMSELDKEAMQAFYRNDKYVDAKTTTKSFGLATVLPDMITDEVQFDPCGYSVNALSNRDGTYFTVHVTPEDHFSFVSFETNSSMDIKKVVKDVIAMFRPRRFSILTSDVEAPRLDEVLEGVACRFVTSYEFEEGNTIAMYNFEQKKSTASFAA